MPFEPAQVYFKQFEDRLKPGVDPLPLEATDEEIDAAYERVGWASADAGDAADVEGARESVHASAVSGDVERILKRKPITFDQFAQNYRESWL